MDAKKTETTDAVVNSLTTGDARRMILQTIMDLRSGNIAVDRGLAIAANMKVLNDSLSNEINATKVVLQAKAAGADFGGIVPIGQRKIGG